MTKQELIESAYGEHWGTVKEHIKEEDGSLPCFLDYMDDDCRSLWHECGFDYNDIEHTGGDMEPMRWRPNNLSGIEDNNGWVKIENVKDLPTSNMFCQWLRKDGQLSYFKRMEWGDNHLSETFTHYKILEGSLPLY